MTDTTQPASQPVSRDGIALKVINLAGIGIGVAALAVLVIAWGTYNKDDPESGKQSTNLILTVFNTIVPVFGTWVGTVIAFYFARENFESAAKSTRELVGQLGDDKLKQIPVKDVWIPVNSIVPLEVEPDKEGEVSVQEKIQPMLNATVSRVPVWNSTKTVRYVLHESMIYRYLSCRPNDQPPTFANFLEFDVSDGKKMKAIVSKFALVAQTATLADAKAKMEGTPDCQDVFVTADGNPGPVLGWITNADIAKKSRP